MAATTKPEKPQVQPFDFQKQFSLHLSKLTNLPVYQNVLHYFKLYFNRFSTENRGLEKHNFTFRTYAYLFLVNLVLCECSLTCSSLIYAFRNWHLIGPFPVLPLTKPFDWFILSSFLLPIGYLKYHVII